MTCFQAVVFAILMGGGGGILEKHPDYVMEKLDGCDGQDDCFSMLDTDNQATLKQYFETWKIPKPDWMQRW
jgi:hypothetical protein